MMACAVSHVETAVVLLQNGADVNMQDIQGWCPLLMAINCRDSEIVSLLIQNNAHIDMQTWGANSLNGGMSNRSSRNSFTFT